jgi:hypothetical protein
VVLWHGKIGGMEQQYWKKYEKGRVKWQERITKISVSAGSSTKMAEVGVTAWKSVDLAEGVTAWKSTNLAKEGVTAWTSAKFSGRRCNGMEINQFSRRRCNNMEIGRTLHYLVSRKFFNFHELIV